MSFPYRADQIREIVKARKVLRSGEFLQSGKGIPFQAYGENGRRIDVLLDLADGPLLDLKLHIRGPIYSNPETFEASLLLSGVRVRGIGWNPTNRSRFYRERIPRGWHENVIDPNLPTDHPDQNRHEALPNFEATDLTDLFTKAAGLWNIDLNLEAQLW